MGDPDIGFGKFRNLAEIRLYLVLPFRRHILVDQRRQDFSVDIGLLLQTLVLPAWIPQDIHRLLGGEGIAAGCSF